MNDFKILQDQANAAVEHARKSFEGQPDTPTKEAVLKLVYFAKSRLDLAAQLHADGVEAAYQAGRASVLHSFYGERDN